LSKANCRSQPTAASYWVARAAMAARSGHGRCAYLASKSDAAATNLALGTASSSSS
jgi:hypothetical protein